MHGLRLKFGLICLFVIANSQFIPCTGCKPFKRETSSADMYKPLRSFPQVDDMESLFMVPMLEYYESTDAAATTKEWNLERQAIIREAVQKLVPQLQEEISGRLLGDARETVVEQFFDALWSYASLPPVQATLPPRPSRSPASHS